MNEHEWFFDRIVSYLADQLADDERARFDAHRETCPACAGEFDQLKQTEQTMTALFADIIPAPDFEQRLLGRLRFSAASRFHPVIRRAAIAAAAAIVLGGVGFVASHQYDSGRLSINRVQVGSSLRQIGQAILPHANENKGAYPPTSYGWFDSTNHETDGQNVLHGDGHVEYQQSPFYGVARDNLFPRQGQDPYKSPRNADDTVLLPPDKDGDGIADTGLSTVTGGRLVTDAKRHEQPMSHGEPGIRQKLESRNSLAFGNQTAVDKSGAGVVTLNSQNTYAGSLVISGGKTSISGPAPTTPNVSHFFFDSTPTNTDYYRPNVAQPTSPAIAVEHFDALKTDQAEVGKRLEHQKAQQPPAKDILRYPADYPQIADAAGKNQEPDQPANGVAPTTRPGSAATSSAPAPSADPIVRKVIRNGDVEFEVDSFDSAALTITKIVGEETGYIATTNSEKLPNGKVKGVIVVRVPPDHLDTLVMKLRALGDLKRQNLTASDVTKEYTDTASELRAARAMEDRLLAIIKSSQGQIKDLLAAEKELATWRGKIEKMEGELRYYDSLVALSTLNVSLFERDIRKADVLKETENVDMGVESEDVEQSRASAIKAIDDAKGRIVESELKKLDAGQLAAKVVAEIPPDTAGPALDRLKQLGKVARMESHRTQKSANDQPATSDTKLERGETHLVLSIYNLANIAPRQTTNLNLATQDVEQAYNAILKLAADAGGRVVTSNLNRQTDQQTGGVVQIEVKSSEAENVLSQIRGNGEVNRLTVTENPDTSNVTTAKRGFNVQIVSLASLTPREVNNRSIATADVDASYQSMLATLRKSQARIIVSRTEDQGNGQHNAYIDFEIPRTKVDEIEKALSGAGETFNRSVNAAADAENVTDSKVQFKLGIAPASSLAPRETDALGVEASDIDSAAQSFQTAAKNAGGKIIDSNFSKTQRGQTARIIVEVPYASANQIVAEAKRLGTVRGSQQTTNTQSPSGELARARIDLTLASPDVLVTPEHGVLATLRNGLSTSFAGLMWSLELIVIGLCLVAPWVLVLWIGVKMLRRVRRKESAATVS